MKMMKKIMLTVATIGAISLPKAYADKIEINPVFTYGESLNQTQFDQTKQTLGVQPGGKELLVKINELNGLLHDNYPYKQVYSSAYITPAQNEGDVTVEILTPQTITAITPLQYQNAAITSGAIDVHIKVASAVKVDGSGALAGVYKAFQDQGHTLDQEAIAAAQKELSVTAGINQEHQGQEGYDPELLNGAITEIKTSIQQYKQENNVTQISQDEITNIVNNVVNNYNLQNILTQNNIQNINQFSQDFSKIELSDAQKQQLQNLGNDILKEGGALFDNVKNDLKNLDLNVKVDEETKGEIKNAWDAFLNILSQIVDAIAQLFKSIGDFLSNLGN